MRSIIRIIDSISEYTGKLVCWACVALVGALTYEVAMRYVFTAPTIWAHEISYMLGGTIVILGAAYTLRHHGHVRIDVFYTRLSPKWKAIIDIVCGLLFFFPLIIILTYTAASEMWFSWSTGEVLIETIWYPPAGPIRTVMFLGLLLLALQGIAQLIRDSYLLIRNKPL
jgi:TRAP-type mannitol/chloroaromatic compound transport system permease small subunit